MPSSRSCSLKRLVRTRRPQQVLVLAASARFCFHPKDMWGDPINPWFVAGPIMFAYIWRCLRPAQPRDACATTYDFGAWGRELKPVVEYFKDKNRHSAGDLSELLDHLGVKQA